MLTNRRLGPNDEGGELVYARRRNGAWSTPIDVLVSSGNAGPPSMALDSKGFLHVAWAGGSGAHYSRAHVAEAGSARGWTKTEILIYEPTLTHAVAVGADGSVDVVASTLDGRLMYRRSDDGGANWNAPVTLVGRDGPRDGVGVDLPRVAVDPSGRVHVVWGDYVFPAGWPPLGVWYMRSADRGRTWQDAQNIDSGAYGLINVAVNGSDTVHLLWHGTAGGTHDRKYRRSVNGGLSWDSTEQVVPSLSGGFNGVSGLDIDSAGTPHIATCMDTTPFLGTAGPRTTWRVSEDGGPNRLQCPAMPRGSDRWSILGSPSGWATSSTWSGRTTSSR